MRRFCYLFFLLFPVLLQAEVYSIWPFTPGSGTFGDPAEVLPNRKFWQEKISVNGMDVVMEISLVELPFADASKVLQKKYPNARIALNPQSMLMSIPQKNGSVKRIFLTQIRGTNPLLQYSMDIPANRKQSPQKAWPDHIPLLPGATDLSVMEFPDRRSVYASCFLPGTTRPQMIHEMSLRLNAAGWKPASEEIANPFRASGEVFYREKPLEILLLGVSASDAKGTAITVYTRPVDPAPAK